MEKLLSEELKNQLDYGNTKDVLITANKKNKKRKVVPKAVRILAEKRAKLKLKKAKVIQDKKDKQAKRTQLYSSLNQHQLTESQIKLLHTTGKLGSSDTKRERVQRAYLMQKENLELDEEAKDVLYQQMDEFTNLEVCAEKQAEEAKEEIVENTNATIVQVDMEQKQKVKANRVMEEAMAALQVLREKNKRNRDGEIGETNARVETMEMDGKGKEVYVPERIEMEKLLQFKGDRPKLEIRKKVVKVKRRNDIAMARMQLPVCSAEQEVMEGIVDHDVLILCGETGSGKTTQVPQFLYEAGFGMKDGVHAGMIGVTQPRRVAAISTAKRVADELNIEFGKYGPVGYQIRYDVDHVGKNTAIKFMTDGIMIKEVMGDFLLRQYSVILLDEAHERNVNTDILIGLLSRIVPLRREMAKEEELAYNALTMEQQATHPKPIQPLKLVIMSATLRVEDFTLNSKLFPTPPPVLKVEARQFPVTNHFSRTTELENYVDAAFKKVCQIHRKLPSGGILVFLTGQQEILDLCRKLEGRFPNEDQAREKLTTTKRVPKSNNRRDTSQDIREHDDEEALADLEEAENINTDDENDSDADAEMEDLDQNFSAVVLPLYSLLDNAKQMRIFEKIPENHRLIVVSTNVAETSLTIPGVSYVVDAGRTKARVFDKKTGISEFKVQWISKASADQRAGRAGRTGPGHCYRLFSSAVFDNEFEQFSPPEIICRPIEDLVLQMKSMGINNVEEFPFPTPPDQVAVKSALALLRNLGAIELASNSITDLGLSLSQYPIGARYAKMLLLAKQLGKECLEYTIAMVASLSGQSPFLHSKDSTAEIDDSNVTPNMDEEWEKLRDLERKAQWIHPESDVLGQLRAAGAYAYAGATSSFCAENYIHKKTMQQMLKLREQITKIVNRMFINDEKFDKLEMNRYMDPPSLEQEDVLRQIITAGFLDNVARKVPNGTIVSGSRFEKTCAYLSCHSTIQEPLYIHPHSNLFHAGSKASKLPEFIVYQTIVRTSRAYMKTITLTSKSWIATAAYQTPLCSLSPPLSTPPPIYNTSKDRLDCFATIRFGDHRWPLTTLQIPYPIPSSKDDPYYRWLARFILEGKVHPAFKRYTNQYTESPSTLTKKKFDKKIQLFLHDLHRKKIISQATLSSTWQEDPTFLLSSTSLWLQHPSKLYFP